MSSPQLEDGYLRLANELVETLMQTNLSGYQYRILWAVWKQTYGYQRKGHSIPNSDLTKMTGLNKNNVSRTLKELLEKGIITRPDDTDASVLAFNKDYSKWQKSQTRGPGRLPAGAMKLPVSVQDQLSKLVTAICELVENELCNLLGSAPGPGQTAEQLAEQLSKLITALPGLVAAELSKLLKKNKDEKKGGPISGQLSKLITAPGKPETGQLSKLITAPGPDATKNPDVRLFLDFACKTYQEKFGYPLVIDGGKDGQTVKNLLKIFDLDSLQELWQEFLMIKNDFIDNAGRSIGVFRVSINTLTSGRKAKPQACHDEGRPPTPGQIRREKAEGELRKQYYDFLAQKIPLTNEEIIGHPKVDEGDRDIMLNSKHPEYWIMKAGFQIRKEKARELKLPNFDEWKKNH